jgi:hypothetical protein
VLPEHSGTPIRFNVRNGSKVDVKGAKLIQLDALGFDSVSYGFARNGYWSGPI